MKTYGRAELLDNTWHIQCEPHVMIRLKRVCAGINKRAVGTVKLVNTPENATDLKWFSERFPLTFSPPGAIEKGVESHRDHIARIQDIVSKYTPPADFGLKLPPREYQAVAASLCRASGSLLVGDDVGLGKTVTAIATISDPAYLPAIVVAPNHLLTQWRDKIAEFTNLRTYVTPGRKTPEKLPEADIYITSYSRIAGWAEVLAAVCKSVVYDEIHELRRDGSQKYNAAIYLTNKLDLYLGLSATPIYNYGSEMYTVLQTLAPKRLGSWDEFVREWCADTYDSFKAKLNDPAAFGSYLRDQGLYIRRSRADVSRELPPVTTVVQTVEADKEALDAVGDQVRALAEIILKGTDQKQRFVAGGELDAALRQATGVAKAPYVAEFVKLLVESGEPVLLACWHHAVYDILDDRFKQAGLRTAKYTGAESTAQKDAARNKWVAGELDVLMISLRSGSGLDGLQTRGSVVVVGELDWSPAVLEQLVGRLHRDGQEKNVLVYYLVAEDGADPVMAETLNLKRAQLDGVRNRTAADMGVQSDGQHLRRLAARYLNITLDE